MEAASGGHISLSDFLEEAELQQYFGMFRDILKVTKASQLKFVNSVDLRELGLSKPEQRRYKKIYTKHFGKQYLSRIKRMLSSSKRNEPSIESNTESPDPMPFQESALKIPTKHIITVEDITINKELGTGEFGVVQQGTWTNDNQRIQVAIKCLGRERMHSSSMEFLKEAAVMHSIDHPNVVRLYGVVLHPDSLMLVTELAPLRSLLECLKEFALRENFPVTTLCNFAEQICDGMTYLESKRLIHRDLAARNILVFNKSKVKISDFGLSRALGVGKDYYQTNYNVNLKLPVAWCAAECITYLRFTTASDVWAYAVTLWEMFSYGFQPWAAFSGHQILTAIDEPNFQRLERPECCPEDYYSVMLECWAHDPAMRPRFKNLSQQLRNIRPPQVVAKTNSPQVECRRANLLVYRAGDVITVLGKERLSNCSMWCGVLSNGAAGLFDPDATIPFTPIPKAALAASTSHGTAADGKPGGLASTFRSSFLRTESKRQAHAHASRRALQRATISAPQGDVKHTGHVGLDGAYFGDVSFLSTPGSGALPRQIVTPYRPSEDLEEVPLLNPSSPSHLMGGASSTPPYNMLPNDAASAASAAASAAAAAPRPDRDCDEVDDANKAHEISARPACKRQGFKTLPPKASKSFISKMKSATLTKSFQHHEHQPSTSKKDVGEPLHDYQEISDNDTSAFEDGTAETFAGRKSQTDFSQSLIDEMEVMFRSLNVPEAGAENPIFKKGHHTNQRAHTLGKKKPNSSEIVKPMSAHEQKTLETAVALANELTTKSMNDLDSKSEKVLPSPSERSKFHFKFPTIGTHHPHSTQDHAKDNNGKQERRNFSQEAQSVPDLQSTITEESRLAYASLIEQPSPAMLVAAAPAHDAPWSAHAGLNRPPSSDMDSEVPGAVEEHSAAPDEALNVLPLPSRGSKPQMVDRTRHIRVHPLVMTGSVETRQSSGGAEDAFDRHGHAADDPTTTNHEYQNFHDIQSAERKERARKANDQLRHSLRCRPEPAYQNVYMNCGVDVCDGASLAFERNVEGLEGGACAGEASASEADDTEKTVPKSPAHYDLGLLLKDAPDHVSVEDLLEFADVKPQGRQRGAESDEVRIISKVLSYEKPKVTEEQCLRALDYTEWSVHAALKVFRLRAQTGHSAGLGACARALTAAEGDLARALAALAPAAAAAPPAPAAQQ